MAADGLMSAVRRQLSIGRLVALGEPADGAWIEESAAVRVLRAASGDVPGIQVRELRLALADPEAAAGAEPAVPPPPSGLPPVPLRIEATCAAELGVPLPGPVRELRVRLLAAAEELLGLDVAAADVHVAELAEPGAAGGDGGGSSAGTAEETGPGARAAVPPEAEAVAAAVLAVPGVRALAPGHGAFFPAAAVEDGGEPPGRLVRLRLVADLSRRTLDVAREAREAAARAAAPGAPGPVTVSLLIGGLR